MNTVDGKILPQIPKYRFVCLLLLNVFSEFFILGRKDAIKEFSFLQFLPKWRFPNSTQQKCAKRKSLLSTEMKGGRSMVFLQGVFDTHRPSFSISASFFIPEKQLLQTWPGTGTQSIVLVTFMPHFTWVGIFFSLFFRLFFYLFI